MIKILVIILIILAAAFFVGGGYFLGLQGSSTKTESVTTPTPTNSVSPTVTVVVTTTSVPIVSPTAKPTAKPVDTITAIENSFISGDFSTINPNLADSVTLIAYATSCCGSTTDFKKVADFISGYVAKGKNWIFNPTDAKYSGLKKEGDLYVVAEDGRSLVFKLNEAKKLEKVTFFSSYQLAN